MNILCFMDKFIISQNHIAMHRYIGFNTFNHQFIKCVQGFRDCLLPRLTMADKLANE